MNLSEIKQHAVQAMGFDRLNAMQEQMLEVATSGRDVLLLSPTGTGKTLAYLLPIVAACKQTPRSVQALVIVPSRELAKQIAEVFGRLQFELRCVCCYGGHDVKTEQQALAAQPKPCLIVGTPGRIKDHLERGNITTKNITLLVLDEYDKSLEMGFEEEMRDIVDQLDALKQRLLTSATHAVPIANYLGMKRYEKLDFTTMTGPAAEGRNTQDCHPDNETPALQGKLELRQVKSPINDKLETLGDLLFALGDDAQVIIFSNYRESSERISNYLHSLGIEHALYHGGLEQELREKALIRFRGGSIRILVSTDLASRGLDIPDVAHIVHYHLPTSEEAFTHRNGRTARAGTDGTAYLIVGPEEFVPAYLDHEPLYFNIRHRNDMTFKPTPWVTVYIGRGKRHKISRGDVLGFFVRNGQLDGKDVGRIDIMEQCAYVALRREVADEALGKVKGMKIKGQKTHYLIVKGN